MFRTIRLRLAQLLAQLYDQDADAVISAAFDRFAAVLGAGNEHMGPAYMAEVNLGMAGLSRSRARIEDAVKFFGNQLDLGRYARGSLHYTIGNAFSALGQEEDAKVAFEAALADPAFANTPNLASQGHKNLGTSFERLGDEKRTVEHYREALRLSPHLPEAHNALAHFYVRQGEWKHALSHLDQAVFTDFTRAKAAGVAGWRANVLFNMGDGSAAFREINGLLVQAGCEPWIWPFSARLVTSFGRTTTENARQALGFWHRYVGVHPEDLRRPSRAAVGDLVPASGGRGCWPNLRGISGRVRAANRTHRRQGSMCLLMGSPWALGAR